jgi:hypothetical protein
VVQVVMAVAAQVQLQAAQQVVLDQMLARLEQ